MKPLVKVMLILGSLFALTFVAGRLLGILTVENVKQWLEWAESAQVAIGPPHHAILTTPATCPNLPPALPIRLHRNPFAPFASGHM
jgi:hypothetical protein